MRSRLIDDYFEVVAPPIAVRRACGQRGLFLLRSVDLILVKGKTQPVEVFTALGPRTPGTPEPGAALAAIFFARCAALRENPPPGHWTGVFTMLGK